MGANTFVPFGPDHVAVLAGLAVGVVALVTSVRRLRAREDRRIRRALALLLLGNEVFSWAMGLAEGRLGVPLQLCDLALLLTVWALWSLRPLIGELAYFWGVAGSLQAIVTPDLQAPFPHYWWVQFFLGHCGVILGVVYLAVTDRVQPTARSVWRVWGMTNLYAVVAGLANWMAGTNYGYLAHKPSQPSLLDHLGPWPSYLLGMEIVALGSFYLAYAPLALGRRRGRSQSP